MGKKSTRVQEVKPIKVRGFITILFHTLFWWTILWVLGSFLPKWSGYTGTIDQGADFNTVLWGILSVFLNIVSVFTMWWLFIRMFIKSIHFISKIFQWKNRNVFGKIMLPFLSLFMALFTLALGFLAGLWLTTMFRDGLLWGLTDKTLSWGDWFKPWLLHNVNIFMQVTVGLKQLMGDQYQPINDLYNIAPLIFLLIFVAVIAYTLFGLIYVGLNKVMLKKVKPVASTAGPRMMA